MFWHLYARERRCKKEELMRAGLFVTGAAVVLVFVWLSATSNDCWNGALSDDPLHCYVMEQV